MGRAKKKLEDYPEEIQQDVMMAAKFIMELYKEEKRRKAQENEYGA